MVGLYSEARTAKNFEKVAFIFYLIRCYYWFMNSQSPAENTTIEIEQAYQEFLVKLDLLKKEQEQVIKEYREKLEQRKLFRLKEQLSITE